MSTAVYEIPRRRARRLWPALRGAQALLLLPLGALQLLAVWVAFNTIVYGALAFGKLWPRRRR